MTEKTNVAITLLNAKRYEAADFVINNLIEVEPNNFEYLFLRGRSLYMQEKYSEALNVYFRLLRINPGHINLLLSVCDASMHLGLVGVALASISKAIEINPGDVNLYKTKIEILEHNFKEYKDDSIIKHVAKKEILASTEISTEVVILCAGEASRWNSHLGVKQKQLIPIEGQILLERTLEQVSKYLPRKITVLAGRGEVDIFTKHCHEGVLVREIELPSDIETPAWKYLSSEKYWNRDGETISLLGDVWFSDSAIEKIFNAGPEDWLAFGRTANSVITGCPYGEIFAHKFRNFEKHSRGLSLLDELYRTKLCSAHASGWALSQVISNEDPNIRTVGDNFVEINDFTEDFDFPEDYERWIANRNIELPS